MISNGKSNLTDGENCDENKRPANRKTQNMPKDEPLTSKDVIVLKKRLTRGRIKK